MNERLIQRVFILLFAKKSKELHVGGLVSKK